MDRLGVLDAEFLDMEDGAAHMHIAGLCTFRNPAPSLDEVTALIASKLHAVPHYRHVVRRVPLDLGRPVWIDDEGFDLEYHVRHTALPKPGGEAELTALMGRLMSQPLDMDRPPWEAWLIDGLSDDRWALIFKTHHCMVDGIAGMGMLTAVLSIEPEPELEPSPPWTAKPAPSGQALVVDAWLNLVKDASTRVARLPSAILHPLDTSRSLVQLAGGFRRLGRSLARSPGNSSSTGIGPHRVWAQSSVGFGDIRTIRAERGGTVNDVVLAAIAGAYRELILSRGQDPGENVVRVGIPVSMRASGDEHVADNEVSAMVADLPVHLADPLDRLQWAKSEMRDLKNSHEAEAGAALFSVAELFPPAVVRAGTRLIIAAEHLRPQGILTTIVTNVPGPQFPVFCLGREMLSVVPFVGLSYGVPIVTAVISYNGRFYFGVTGDRGTAADVGVLADAIGPAMLELRSAALKG